MRSDFYLGSIWLTSTWLGWNTLQVISTQKNDDPTTMYAAGYIEGRSAFSASSLITQNFFCQGFLTKDLIWQSWGPFLYVQFNNSGYNFPPGVSYIVLLKFLGFHDLIRNFQLIKFYRDNLAYMQQMISSNPKDPYWVHVGLVLQQLNGL